MTTRERNETHESIHANSYLDNRQEHRHSVDFLLKELVDDETFALVCRALFHAELDIALGASLVLGRMKDARATPYLLRASLTTDQRRAEAVMWSLGEIGDEAALPILLAALDENFVPKSAILALGKIGSPVSVDAISASLNDADETTRLLAVKALGQIKFGRNDNLIEKTRILLADQLAHEVSRRVKLSLAVVKRKLEQRLEQ